MPYHTINDLPENVTNVLPTHAQEIFVAAFNSAYEEYKDAEDRKGGDRELVARKVAWSAVKHKYHKTDDGKWHLTK